MLLLLRPIPGGWGGGETPLRKAGERPISPSGSGLNPVVSPPSAEQGQWLCVPRQGLLSLGTMGWWDALLSPTRVPLAPMVFLTFFPTCLAPSGEALSLSPTFWGGGGSGAGTETRTPFGITELWEGGLGTQSAIILGGAGVERVCLAGALVPGTAGCHGRGGGTDTGQRRLCAGQGMGGVRGRSGHP